MIKANTKADIKVSVEMLKDKKNREYFQIKDIRIKLKVGDATGKLISQNTNRNNDALSTFHGDTYISHFLNFNDNYSAKIQIYEGGNR